MAADQLRPLDYQDRAILFRGLEISQDLETRCRDTHMVISRSDIEVLSRHFEIKTLEF